MAFGELSGWPFRNAISGQSPVSNINLLIYSPENQENNFLKAIFSESVFSWTSLLVLIQPFALKAARREARREA